MKKIVFYLSDHGFAYANYLLDSTLEQVVTTEVMVKEETEIAEVVIEKEEQSQVINLAVFGLDKNSNGRSDAMKVLSLDKKNKLAKVTSLQRDTLIYIPG